MAAGLTKMSTFLPPRPIETRLRIIAQRVHSQIIIFRNLPHIYVKETESSRRTGVQSFPARRYASAAERWSHVSCFRKVIFARFHAQFPLKFLLFFSSLDLILMALKPGYGLLMTVEVYWFSVKCLHVVGTRISFSLFFLCCLLPEMKPRFWNVYIVPGGALNLDR